MRAYGKATLPNKSTRFASARSSATDAGSGAINTLENNPESSLALLPLPWPAPGVSIREARRPHAHRCISCACNFQCAGPDQSRECAPVCGPCMWVELGSQLRMYRSIADIIDRRRRKIESQVGAAACRKAQSSRRDLLRTRNVLAGFGQMVLTRGDSAQPGLESDFSRINPSGEGY